MASSSKALSETERYVFLPVLRYVANDITQTQALKNLDAVFKSAGSGLAHAVKLTVFVRSSTLSHHTQPNPLSHPQITDYSKFAEMNTAYLAMMPSPPPARSCIGVRALPFGTDVEIEAVAVIPSTREAKL